MLRAVKQRALSAAVADSLTNSPRDSPAVSLSGKGRTAPPTTSWNCGLPRVRGDPQVVFAIALPCWRQRLSSSSLHSLVQSWPAHGVQVCGHRSSQVGTEPRERACCHRATWWSSWVGLRPGPACAAWPAPALTSLLTPDCASLCSRGRLSALLPALPQVLFPSSWTRRLLPFRDQK